MSPFAWMLFVMLACAARAVWPMLQITKVRLTLLGATGGSCVMLGAALFATALLSLPEFGQQVFAADTKADDSPTDATAPAATESAPKQKPAPSTDPEIEVVPNSVIIPPGRPAWVDSEPDYSSDVHTLYVGSGPFVSVAEANRALDKALEEATNDYVVEQLGSSFAKKILGYDAAKIKKRFVQKDLYREVITVSVGPMHQVHALLKFEPKFRADLEQRWAKVRGTSRLVQTGLFSAGGLLLLTTVFGFFRANQATRGTYARRLQFMTALAILAVIGFGLYFARHITWL